MFKVKSSASGEVYTVYAVRVDEDGNTMFLLYTLGEGWVWKYAAGTIPVIEE